MRTADGTSCGIKHRRMNSIQQDGKLSGGPVLEHGSKRYLKADHEYLIYAGVAVVLSNEQRRPLQIRVKNVSAATSYSKRVVLLWL